MEMKVGRKNRGRERETCYYPDYYSDRLFCHIFVNYGNWKVAYGWVTVLVKCFL